MRPEQVSIMPFLCDVRLRSKPGSDDRFRREADIRQVVMSASGSIVPQAACPTVLFHMDTRSPKFGR